MATWVNPQPSFNKTKALVRTENSDFSRTLSKEETFEKRRKKELKLKELDEIKKVFRTEFDVNDKTAFNKTAPDIAHKSSNNRAKKFLQLRNNNPKGEVFYLDKNEVVLAYTCCIPFNLVNSFNDSVEQLIAKLVELKVNSKSKKNGEIEEKRGHFQTFHICVWFRSHDEPFISVQGGGGYSFDLDVLERRQLVSDQISEFRRENSNFFKHLKNIIKLRLPDQWKILSSLRFPENVIPQTGILRYPGFAINWENDENVVSIMHKDVSDIGMAMVIPIGSFRGGDLIFDSPFNVRVPLKPGKMVCFLGQFIPHWNLPVKPPKFEPGLSFEEQERIRRNLTRKSIVFFTCNKLYSWSEKVNQTDNFGMIQNDTEEPELKKQKL